MSEYTDDQLDQMEGMIDEVSTDYKDLLQSAGIDFKKARAAMKAHIRGRKKDTSDISSSVEEAQKKAQKALADFASVNTLISSRNTLNVELRRPKKSNVRHARNPLHVLKYMQKRIENLEDDAYDANPDDSGGLKAYVTEVHALESQDLETHPMSLNVKKLMDTATKTSASGVSLIMVRAYCPHNHFWKNPEEPTTSPLSSDTDRYRAKCQTSFYGLMPEGSVPVVGDIVSVEFPDETDLSCGILLDVFLRLPAVKTPFNARSAFNGAGPVRVGN